MLAERGENSRGEQRRACDEKFGVRAPSVTLSKREGRSAGVRGKFAPNPANDVGSMTVPFIASRAGSDFGPRLASTTSLAWATSRSLSGRACHCHGPAPVWRQLPRAASSRDNATTAYGLDASSYVADPTDPSEIFSYPIYHFGTRNAARFRAEASFSRRRRPCLPSGGSGIRAFISKKYRVPSARLRESPPRSPRLFAGPAAVPPTNQ